MFQAKQVKATNLITFLILQYFLLIAWHFSFLLNFILLCTVTRKLVNIRLCLVVCEFRVQTTENTIKFWEFLVLSLICYLLLIDHMYLRKKSYIKIFENYFWMLWPIEKNIFWFFPGKNTCNNKIWYKAEACIDFFSGVALLFLYKNNLYFVVFFIKSLEILMNAFYITV